MQTGAEVESFIFDDITLNDNKEEDETKIIDLIFMLAFESYKQKIAVTKPVTLSILLLLT